MSWVDSLYLQGKILELLCNKEKFEEFIKSNKVSEPYIKGYVYLIEVTINTFMNCIEYLINDDTLYDLIHYKGVNLRDIPKKYRDSNQELIFIHSLEKIRERLKKDRINVQKTSKTVDILKEIVKKINDILSYYLSGARVEINTIEKQNEKFYFIIELTNKQNYIDVDFDTLGKKSVAKPIPLYPACAYYNLGYPKVNSEYHLQNPQIKTYEVEYVKGYSLGLAFIYDSLEIVPKDLITEFLELTDWIKLHKQGSKIYDSLIKDTDIHLVSEIYKEKEIAKTQKLEKEKIDYKDLKSLFRSRDVFIIEPRDRGYPTEIVPFLLSLISGRLSFEDNPEIIELRTEREDKEIWFSYAFFIPYGASMWNGSYWVLFRDVGFEREDYKTDGKCVLDNFISSNTFEVHKHEIENKILDRYLRELDFKYQIKEKLETMLKDSNSLLIELLSLYYHTKYESGEITSIDWGIEIKKDDTNSVIGEADIIIYLKDKIVIVQSKNSLNTSIDDLVKHFETIEAFLKKNKADKLKDKQIKRELFVFFKEYNMCDSKGLIEKSINLVCFEDLLKDNLFSPNVKSRLSSCIKQIFGNN